MKIEHIGYQVEDPVGMARWYVEHLGFAVMRKIDESPFAHFLADGSGTVMIEIYRNPQVAVPDYREMDPLTLHLALGSADVTADRQRLIEAGATPLGEIDRPDNGDILALLRDPWGLPIQLAKRGQPMVSN